MTPATVEGDPWTETTLYSFADFGTNVNAPNTLYAGVMVGGSGDVYGTTFNSHISMNGKSEGVRLKMGGM